MNIAVISDIHENFHNLTATLEYLVEQGITDGFVLGDLINPGIMHKLGESGISFRVIFGNNDGDRFMLTKAASDYSNIELADIYSKYEIEGIRIFATHYMELAEIAFKSGDYAISLGGHDHIRAIKHENQRLLLNPGELSGHTSGNATFAIINLQTLQAESYILEGEWVDVKAYKRNASLPSVKKLEAGS